MAARVSRGTEGHLPGQRDRRRFRHRARVLRPPNAAARSGGGVHSKEASPRVRPLCLRANNIPRGAGGSHLGLRDRDRAGSRPGDLESAALCGPRRAVACEARPGSARRSPGELAMCDRVGLATADLAIREQWLHRIDHGTTIRPEADGECGNVEATPAPSGRPRDDCDQRPEPSAGSGRETPYGSRQDAAAKAPEFRLLVVPGRFPGAGAMTPRLSSAGPCRARASRSAAPA
jgi:hypothetical protein